MPELQQILHNQDLSYLQIVAELWGVQIEALELNSLLQRLIPAMKDPSRVEEMVESLPKEGRAALDDLQRNHGRLPWSLFTRRHGEVREMGSARMDRERPQLRPISGTEVLWYRGLVARTFLDSPDGPQEFATIPSELLTLLPEAQTSSLKTLGRPAKPKERAVVIPANDRLLDHATTILAALRLGYSEDRMQVLATHWGTPGVINPYNITPKAIRHLLRAADLLDASDIPAPDAARHFLEMPRAKALAQFARDWLYSPKYNDLHMLPDLLMEGEWQNDPLRARYAILDFLENLPQDTWWNLGSFVDDIHESQPDYQRPAGDYDSWYIRSRTSGEFLSGFEHWNDVDGALIRYIILGPLHWLGVVDLATPAPDAAPTAFKFSRWATALLAGAPPDGVDVEDDAFLISSDARIRVPRLVPRSARYQLARFSDWESEGVDAYLYRLTPASLERAREQGLRVIHLLTLLRRYALAVPPSLGKALERWQEYGTEARIQRVHILRLKNPDMLQMLRASRAARFLGEPLGPTTVIVNVEAAEKVLAILAEMGYLGEVDLEIK